MGAKTLHTIGVGLVVLFAQFRLGGKDVVIKYVGNASDLSSDTFFYTEEHEEYTANNLHTLTKIHYKDVKGNYIVHKTIDYSLSQTSPNFLQEDMRDGYTEGAKAEGNDVTITYRKNSQEKLKTQNITVPSPVVIDGGFNCFVKNKWEEIQKGNTVKFNFVVPSQLDYFTFRVKKKGEDIQEGKKWSIIQMEADNFFIRSLVAPIILTYDDQTMRLKKYEGLSNINDSKGKSYLVKLVYPTVGP